MTSLALALLLAGPPVDISKIPVPNNPQPARPATPAPATPKTPGTPATPKAQAGNPLAGRWEGSAFTLVLEADGRGSITVAGTPADPLTWRSAGNTLSFMQDGETTTYTYSQRGESMTLSGGDLEMALTFQRTGGATSGKKGIFGGKDQPANPQPAAKQPKITGTCQGACEHMLTCAGQGSPIEIAQCVMNCSRGTPDAQKLAGVEAMTCEQTNAMLLQAAQAAQQQQQQRGRGGSGRKECQGCVRDGNNCVWLSQGNWGSGYANPYSGAAADCDPSCCQ